MPLNDLQPAERAPDPIPGDLPSLSELAREQRRRWEAALAQGGTRLAGLDPEALAAQIAEAGRQAVERIARALLQEGILSAEMRGGEAEVAIPGPDGEVDVLVVQGLRPDEPSLFPQLRLLRRDRGGAPKPIEDPVELLEFVAPAVRGATRQSLARLAGELTDGWLNDALCNAYRAAWSARLRSAAAGRTTFWDWLKDYPGRQDQVLMLEQWSATGHPYHPTHKTRLGMTPAEVLSSCPEFEPQVEVGLLAARRARVHGETMPGTPPVETWLERHFPVQAEAWRAELIDQGRDPGDYVALPVHPWQARHVIPERFSRSIASGDLVPLAGPTIPSTPMIPVRTLVPRTPADAPHLKMSLGVRLTSVERTISPRSCEMGPRISKLLQDLIDSDAALSATLGILPEEAGLYYASAVPEEREEARHLAALLRRSLSLLLGSDDIAIPTTALTAASPMTGAPLFLEISEAPANDSPAAVQARFAIYAEALLRPLLTLYLRYGVGLEAHQQNTVALYSCSGALRHFLFRDFGGIRIHEPSLRAAGLALDVHADRLTVIDDRAAVRSKLTSRTFQYHLGFLISRLCQHLGTSEGPYWADVADAVQTIMDDLRGDVAAATWRQERAAFLEEDWGVKASLRMRFEEIPGDVYLRGENPLRWGGH